MFCVDEKTAIQPLDRKEPIVPLSPGRAERHGFEYVRRGAERHTGQAFVVFLADLLTKVPRGKIHIICDNLSAHKTARVHAFLAEHPRVHRTWRSAAQGRQ